MAYSLDFRKQVFKVQKKENLSDQEVSIHFGISSRSLQRWKKRLEPIQDAINRLPKSIWKPSKKM